MIAVYHNQCTGTSQTGGTNKISRPSAGWLFVSAYRLNRVILLNATRERRELQVVADPSWH